MRALKPLIDYEPFRDLRRLLSGGQLDLIPEHLPHPRLSPRGRPPLPLAHVRSVLTGVLAVRTGQQSPTYVQGWVGASLYAQLSRQAPLDVRLTLNGVRGCVVPPSSYEVSATAASAARAYALLARFDLADGAWRCTVFDVIVPPGRR
ncbi:Rv3235 family protein [Amycolatopsis sp. GM8]|uniref:Rv3235 family protein n=1 Tax=Amycolatopsis sp. GM8 TaxID=2896530 RepID=UPI001F40DB39|nr:Rv3235 family protein [Amycolatopsis sp. GM8]